MQRRVLAAGTPARVRRRAPGRAQATTARQQGAVPFCILGPSLLRSKYLLCAGVGLGSLWENIPFEHEALGGVCAPLRALRNVCLRSDELRRPGTALPGFRMHSLGPSGRLRKLPKCRDNVKLSGRGGPDAEKVQASLVSCSVLVILWTCFLNVSFPLFPRTLLSAPCRTWSSPLALNAWRRSQKGKITPRGDLTANTQNFGH